MTHILFVTLFLVFVPQETLMNRVKRQLHEWDENLKDDSLPTNAIGTTPWPALKATVYFCHQNCNIFRYFFQPHRFKS